jgi:hypothetical protein
VRLPERLPGSCGDRIRYGVQPPFEDVVNRFGADDRSVGQHKRTRRQQERLGLPVTEPSVESDEFFEGSALVDFCVEEAIDEEIRASNSETKTSRCSIPSASRAV